MHNKVNILFSSFPPDFFGNPKAFFEFLSSNYCDKFNFSWVIYNATELLSILKSKNINCVLYNSLEYQKLIEDIDIIFDFVFFFLKKNKIKYILISGMVLGHKKLAIYYIHLIWHHKILNTFINPKIKLTL